MVCASLWLCCGGGFASLRRVSLSQSGDPIAVPSVYPRKNSGSSLSVKKRVSPGCRLCYCFNRDDVLFFLVLFLLIFFLAKLLPISRCMKTWLQKDLKQTHRNILFSLEETNKTCKKIPVLRQCECYRENGSRSSALQWGKKKIRSMSAYILIWYSCFGIQCQLYE